MRQSNPITALSGFLAFSSLSPLVTGIVRYMQLDLNMIRTQNSLSYAGVLCSLFQ